MGISRTWPRAGAHVGSITEPTKVYKCMTNEERNKPGGMPQLKDILRKVHNLQVAALGVLEITVETRYQRDMPNQTCVLVSVRLHSDHLSGRSFVFYQWRESMRNEDELAELNQHAQFLIELSKPLAYANKT